MIPKDKAEKMLTFLSNLSEAMDYDRDKPISWEMIYDLGKLAQYIEDHAEKENPYHKHPSIPC